MKKTTQLILAVSLLAVATAPAATVASYALTTNLNATTVAPLTSASAIGNIGAFAGSSGTQLDSGASGPLRSNNGTTAPIWTFGSGNWLYANALGDGATTPSSSSEYFNFTLSTPGSETLTLTSLTFDYGVGTNGTADSGVSTTWNYAVFASVNGGSFTLLPGSSFSGTATLTQSTTHSFGPQTVDLSSISGADSVELRVWVGSSSAGAGSGSIFRNISVDGAVVPVPEPSVALLGGLGMLALLRRRRSA